MPQDTLYIKIDENVQVHERRILLKDIAEIMCSNREIENKVRTLKLENAVGETAGRYVKSVMEVIACIQKDFPGMQIQNLGGADFIITYEMEHPMSDVMSWLKTILVCILSFFGAAFSIMTFNNDVDVTGLFAQIYELFTGQTSDGFTVLELSYSLGIGLGIILFFNHFAGRKLTADPTPLEVQMRTYEDDVNQTIIEQERHQNKPKKGQKG